MNGPRIMPPLTSSAFTFEKKDETARMPVFSEPPFERPAKASELPMPPAAPQSAARPSDADAEAAVKTLLRWIGEDAEREGLVKTPARVVRGWKEFFQGYKEDPRDHLKNAFANDEGYNEVVCLENIRLESYCEHHLVPITGVACVAYIPDRKIAGLSKLARVVDGYAKRLQVQEKLTRQIAKALNDELAPKGVAVAIRSEHQCLSTRGIHKPGSEMFTLATFGAFETDPQKRAEFLAIANRAA